ncbi:MAG: flavin reductase family protein [Chloroflexaceae bacterium]|nr:flavin reductase family protein [Chloroflexaceae bacterium]NJO06679.1 flavin reductase family protein [Chloroflexaceae bacterium]
MGIDERAFRTVLSRFASGVTVVTTTFEGRLAGLTVSSFTSLSLKPTLILVCVAHHTDSHSVLEQADQFAVNVLAEDQSYLSQRFASLSEEKFVAGSYTLSARGLPLLNGVLATLECTTYSRLPGGDHSIFVGEVVASHVYEGQPLLYYRAGYYQLGPREP